MSLRDRIEWLFRMALLLFILTSVAFLSAIIAIRFSIQGRQVPMPDVVGKKASDAQLILRGRDLGMTVEDRIYNALPVDEVVRQSPPPNIRVKIGQYAHVVLSLGPQKVSIPPVEGSSVRMARIELLRGGMQVGEISSAYLSEWPADSVVQQDPREGTTDVTSPHENVLVSLGPRPTSYPMPDLVGVPLGDAESRLNAAGLKVAKLNLVPGTASAHGTVVGQTPARGSRVDPSSSIELNVAE
ncbi:MAG TPA: PASTA domain-containing protein [Candidatus Acidoferrales bacterium]|nr:PASTA domain-containing protein [Candidatus Acidoferrales bacterium]